MDIKIELYNDHFENAKRYQIPRAQLIIADIPYNIGINAYGSRSDWYINGDNRNGESEKAGKTFFDTDDDFKIYNFFQFCTRLLRKEPKEKGMAPCMIIFCAWHRFDDRVAEEEQGAFAQYVFLPQLFHHHVRQRYRVGIHAVDADQTAQRSLDENS